MQFWCCLARCDVQILSYGFYHLSPEGSPCTSQVMQCDLLMTGGVASTAHSTPLLEESAPSITFWLCLWIPMAHPTGFRCPFRWVPFAIPVAVPTDSYGVPLLSYSYFHEFL